MDITRNNERSANAGANPAKPFVGVHFKCCNIYVRIYRNRTQDAYEGACPKCRKKVKLPIGSGGTNNRFFEAS